MNAYDYINLCKEKKFSNKQAFSLLFSSITALSKNEHDLVDSINKENPSKGIDPQKREDINEVYKTVKQMSMYDIKEFILNGERIQDYLSNIGVKGTPYSLCKLVEDKLIIDETDTIADLNAGLGNFAFSLEEDLSGLKCDSYISYKEVSECLEPLTTVFREYLNNNLTFINQNILEQGTTKKYSKVFNSGIWGIKDLSGNTIDYITGKVPYIDKSKIKSEHICVLRTLDALTEDGNGIVFVPVSFLNDKSGLIKYLLDENLLDSVTLMADSLIDSYTGNFAMLELHRRKNNLPISIVNASSIYTEIRPGKNELDIDDIANIADTGNEESDYCIFVSDDDIRKKNYSLSPVEYLSSARICFDGVIDYVKLKTFCSIKRGYQYKAEELNKLSTSDETDFYYCTPSHIINNELYGDLIKLKYIDDKLERYTLKENDIIFSMVINDPQRIAICKNLGNKKIIAASNLYIIRVNDKKYDPIFIKALLETKEAFKIFKSFSLGRAVNSLPVETLNNLSIPELPLEKQKKWANEYSCLSERINALRKQLSSLEKERSDILDIRTIRGKNIPLETSYSECDDFKKDID